MDTATATLAEVFAPKLEEFSPDWFCSGDDFEEEAHSVKTWARYQHPKTGELTNCLVFSTLNSIYVLQQGQHGEYWLRQLSGTSLSRALKSRGISEYRCPDVISVKGTPDALSFLIQVEGQRFIWNITAVQRAVLL